MTMLVNSVLAATISKRFIMARPFAVATSDYFLLDFEKPAIETGGQCIGVQ